MLRDRYGDALVSARSLALVFATALAVRLVVFAVSDGSLMAVRVLQLLLGSAACVLIALATARFFARTDFAKPAAAVAGLLLALYPASTSRPLAARHCKRAAPTSRVAELQPVDLLPSHEWAT